MRFPGAPTRYRATSPNPLGSRLPNRDGERNVQEACQEGCQEDRQEEREEEREEAGTQAGRRQARAGRKPAAKAATRPATPLRKGGSDLSWNFKLIAHDTLAGFGGMGEGMAVQVAKDGRRILWLAHESAPKNFTARRRLRSAQAEGGRADRPAAEPHALELARDHRRHHGGRLPDAEDRAEAGRLRAVRHLQCRRSPKSISFIDCSGPHSRGVHQLWFCDGEYVHMASGAPDFKPTHQLDDQFYRIFDVRNPSKPTEVGRWWMPGTREGDSAPPPERHQKPALDKGFRAHNTNVYPQRPDRCYLGYIDAGMFVMDISDKANPKPLCRWDNSPPYTGFTHTVLPLFERNLLVVTDESTNDNAADWPKLVWLLDARDEKHPVPISTCPLPPVDAFSSRGGRFGAHNIHENTPSPHCLALRPDHHRHVLQRRLARLRHLQRLSAEGGRGVRAAGAGAVAGRRDPAQRRVRRRARDRLHGRPLHRRAVRAGDGFLIGVDASR